MKLFFSYLKQRRKIFILYLLFLTIFCIILYLYHIPLFVMLYPSVLCTFIALIFMIADFISIKRKHDQFCRIKGMTASEIAAFPHEDHITENDLADIINELIAQSIRLENDKNEQYDDMIEYYTLWAHQIKTPIASMRLTLQNEDSRLSRQLKSDLFRVEQYVEMVLAFLRLNSESTDYVFAQHSLDKIIRQAVRRFAGEFIGRGIGLEYEPTEMDIITDEKWLSFVIEQIISNALKYTKEGSIKIYSKKPKLLCIEDTGIGIAKEDLPRIFEKGYTGKGGRSDKSASGIGLYLCRRICSNLGAEIKAESEPDRGTVISIDLGQYQLRSE